jgi:hypothetical protein
VAKRSVQVGQQIQAGSPVLAVVPVGEVHVDANFKEGQLARVRIGQPVEVTFRSLWRLGDLPRRGGRPVRRHRLDVRRHPGTERHGNWIKVVQRVPVRIQLDAAELTARPLQVGLSMKPPSTPAVDRERLGECDDRFRESTARRRALRGALLWLVAIVLAGANFIAVLDMTIANVSVPSIAGSLGHQLQPGHLGHHLLLGGRGHHRAAHRLAAARFGAVRVFTTAMGAFGVCSAICGFSTSFTMLVVGRILQGIAGGPLIPLSQTLLLRIFPREKARPRRLSGP